MHACMRGMCKTCSWFVEFLVCTIIIFSHLHSVRVSLVFFVRRECVRLSSEIWGVPFLMEFCCGLRTGIVAGCSVEELRALLLDKDMYNSFLHSLDQVRHLDSVRLLAFVWRLSPNEHELLVQFRLIDWFLLRKRFLHVWPDGLTIQVFEVTEFVRVGLLAANCDYWPFIRGGIGGDLELTCCPVFWI